MKNKSLANASLLAALAIILGYIESLIPISYTIPGIKIGISNVAVLIAIYKLNKKYALAIIFTKIIVTSLLFAGFQSFLYSLTGGVLSLIAMLISKKSGYFSPIGTSIFGGIFHNIGQLFAAAFILNTTSVFYYIPVLLLSGTICGALLGILCNLLIRYLKIL